MPGDDLIEIAVRGLFHGACAFVGFWTLRLLSAGRYPPSLPSDRQLDVCGVVGLAVIAAAIAAVWLAWSGS